MNRLNSDRIRIALAGCGGVARKYRAAYRDIPGVSVQVAIDVNALEAAAARTETNALQASTDFTAALAEDIDAVVISTPNHLHCEQAVAALKTGKHVLLQKPMAPSTAECDEILGAQRSSGATLGIYMNLLDHPLFRDMERMVQEGFLGKVVLYSARLAHRGGLQWGGIERNWRASSVRTGGGSFIQLGVHYQFLMRLLLKAEVVKVQALSRNLACPHIEGDDLTLAQYELSSGALGEIQTSWCCQEEHISILGTKGSIHYRDLRRIEYSGEGGSFDGEVLHLKGDGSPEVLEDCLSPEWGDASNQYNQHRRFVEALRKGRPPDVSGIEGREDVRLVELCYASSVQERAQA